MRIQCHLAVQICLAGALPLMTASPAASAPPATEQIQINLPDNVELKVLIDYVSERLGINFYYDDQVVNQRVTLRAPAGIAKSSLLPLLESVLQSRGLALADAEEAGWKRIVSAANLLQAATTQPSATRPSSVLTQVFKLNTINPATLEPLVRPFLTQPGGVLIAVPDQSLLIITDFSSNVQRVADLVQLLDRARAASVMRFVPVLHVDSTALATQLTSLIAAKAKSAGGIASVGLEIIPEPRANQIVLIGSADGVDDATKLIGSLDVKLQLETRSYRFVSVTPERIDKLAKELLSPAEAKNAYSSTVDDQSGTLIVTTTPLGHEKIEVLKRDLDRDLVRVEQSPIRFYKLQNSTAAEILTTIQAIAGQTSISDVVVTGLGPPSAAQGELPVSRLDPLTATEPPAIAPEIPGLAPVVDSAIPKPLPLAPQTVRAKDATITADINTNSIIVVAQPAVQFVYEQLIKTLDKRRPQVLVECTVVTLDTSGNYQFGVEISGRGSAGSTEFVTFSSFGLSTVGTGAAGATSSGLGRLSLTPGTGFNSAVIAGDIADIVIRALTGSSRARVVSAPKLLVNDNVAATLASVTEAPFTTTSALTGNTSATSFGGFAQAGTTITITPHISEGDMVQLEYSVGLNSFTQEPQGGATTPPPRRSNQLQSKVTIPDGSTIIVGGLKLMNESESKTGVPILSDIPVLGYLFSNRTGSKSESTLFVFIRPIILRDDDFRDLKFLSERAVDAAAIPGSAPKSVPLLMQ